MKVKITKVGGKLLREESDRLTLIDKIKTYLKQGYKVIVVVSAMGRKNDPYATDTFLEYTHYLSKKDKDRLIAQGEIISSLVLANMVNKEQILAYPLDEKEIGIITNSEWGQGKIIALNPVKIHKLLTYNDVLIIPGFIGINKNADIVTLGRGGSDLTAVIVARMLNINRVDYYKDVDGVLSGDPRFINKAKKHDFLSYKQMLLLSDHGAKVMQSNAIVLAMQHDIELNVIPFYHDGGGTLISNKPSEDKYLGIMVEDNEIIIIGDLVIEDLAYINSLIQDMGSYQIEFKENIIRISAIKNDLNQLVNHLHSQLISNSLK